jgi:hypothetical protein
MISGRPYMPGVPAAGHITSRGYWHAGGLTVCSRCALDRPCPTCQAKPGDPCTRPVDDGRVPVAWHHLARESS